MKDTDIEVIKVQVAADIQGALKMLGQAQERCSKGSPAWKELGELYEAVESSCQMIVLGEYEVHNVQSTS